jgi:hypothetical protein
MKANHPSEILMARLLIGRASGDEVRQVDDHARDCLRCKAELEGAQAARSRFDRQVFSRTLPLIEERFAARPRRWFVALGLVTATLGAAAVLVLVLVLVRPAPRPGTTPEAAAFSVKGSGALKLYGRRNGHVFPVEAATVLHPGDQLRFAVQSDGARFVLIASIDGRGQASIYVPSTPIGRDAAVGWGLVGDSIVLDEALGPERVFAVFSNEMLEEEAIFSVLRETATKGGDALRSVKALPLPLVQTSVLFEKTTGENP